MRLRGNGRLFCARAAMSAVTAAWATEKILDASCTMLRVGWSSHMGLNLSGWIIKKMARQTFLHVSLAVSSRACGLLAKANARSLTHRRMIAFSERVACACMMARATLILVVAD